MEGGASMKPGIAKKVEGKNCMILKGMGVEGGGLLSLRPLHVLISNQQWIELLPPLTHAC